jgi:response regulator RpfG family c-di-GMP phosphodiesterase
MTVARYPEADYPHVGNRRLIAFIASAVSSDALDRLLEAGGYDIMLIDSMNDAYTQIKEVMPHLVIVCMQPEEETLGCQVLSMLSLDRETSHIPVLTHLVKPDRQAITAATDGSRLERQAVSLSMN